MSSISHFISAFERISNKYRDLLNNPNKEKKRRKTLLQGYEVDMQSIINIIDNKMNIHGLQRISAFNDKGEETIFFCIAHSPLEVEFAVNRYQKKNSIKFLEYEATEIPTMKNLNI